MEEGIVGKGLVNPADAGDRILHTSPRGVIQVQSGVQNGHQHTLAGKARFPHLAQADHVVAAAIGAGNGVCGQLLFRAFIYMLHIGPLDAVHRPDGLQLAIGDLNGHGVEQVGPPGNHLHLGSGPAGDGLDHGVLTAQQGATPGFDRAGGQILRHRLAG